MSIWLDTDFGIHQQVRMLMKYASESMDDYLERGDGYTRTRYYNNGREKGFHWSIHRPSPGNGYGGPTLNFVWYEHRNSDQLVCIMWENPTTSQHWHEGAERLACADNVSGYQNIPVEVFPDKYGYTATFGYMKIYEAFSWWMKQVTDWFEGENNILLGREILARKISEGEE